ncbi:unnamed protein product [Mytilus coruscus]|uniref:Uncharacterized protein n=1 Tax=Mytilus coruscus TaxID=42192 RepID=A0A6J7ZYF9_MYTCO|nr:unnamed protein product [Mytilus coruscus]
MDEAVNQTERDSHVGIDNLDTFKSSGKFVCEIPGLLYISAHIYTITQSRAFYVRKNTVTFACSVSDSDSTKFGVAEKKRHNALESTQYTLQQDQNRFNQSFDLIFENTKHRSNKTINELFAKQQKVVLAQLKLKYKDEWYLAVRILNVANIRS